MPDTPVLRILDASLNRAGEGLRVVEDFARFVLDDPFLTGELKSLRHKLTEACSIVPERGRHAARETQEDVGREISTAAERQRASTWGVCAASLKRTEQSLRCLEEYGKLLDSAFASCMESLRYRLYTLEKALNTGRSSRERLQDVRLCVLVDGGDSAAEFERLVTELVGAGVGMIQLRDKRLEDRELVERARLLVSLTRGWAAEVALVRQPPAPPWVRESFDPQTEKKPPAEPGAVGHARTLSVINDRADVAAAVHADGVHLGQEDLSVKDARAVVGTEMLIGISTHSLEQARAAVLDGANYLGAGPTFPSHTKAFDSFAGLDYLRAVAAEVRLPTFAIGGITAENLRHVLATGIARVAVSGAIAAAAPASAARELLDILDPAEATTAEAASPSGSQP